MVIEPVEDLDVTAVGQGPVGEVGLPTLVGLGGLEAQVGAFRAFAWLWDSGSGLGAHPGLLGRNLALQVSALQDVARSRR